MKVKCPKCELTAEVNNFTKKDSGVSWDVTIKALDRAKYCHPYRDWKQLKRAGHFDCPNIHDAAEALAKRVLPW